VLPARSKHQQRLGLEVHFFVQQQRSEALSQRGTAGFPGGDDVVSACAQKCRDTFDVRGFAGSVYTLEGNEFSSCHDD
jgi:hypothetical protein